MPDMTLRECGGVEPLVQRRLDAILGLLGDVASGHWGLWLVLPDRSTIQRALLQFPARSGRLRLAVYPGDTLTQARALYARGETTSALLSLRDKGWSVEPNFHFGFRASGLVWTAVEASVEKYVAYWHQRIESTRPWPRSEWPERWGELVRLAFVTDNDKIEFDEKFTNTRRDTATPRPGLKCFRFWRLDEAERLDEAGGFTAAIAEQLNVALRSLGEEPIGLPDG